MTPRVPFLFATAHDENTCMDITVGVLALQGAFLEHTLLLKKAASHLSQVEDSKEKTVTFEFTEVRNIKQLQQCNALIIPGGESTAISFVAAESGLLEPLRDFVKVDRKPVWGTCAGLILLAEAANRTKKGGQELIGGLNVRVNRNHFGRQAESFQAPLDLSFLSKVAIPNGAFPGVFIRAPVVEKVLPSDNGVQIEQEMVAHTIVAPSRLAQSEEARRSVSRDVEIMGVLSARLRRSDRMGAVGSDEGEARDIIAVRQSNVFGTSFHPELTSDIRIHVWWLMQVAAFYLTPK